jgi:hypothetical protein
MVLPALFEPFFSIEVPTNRPVSKNKILSKTYELNASKAVLSQIYN